MKVLIYSEKTKKEYILIPVGTNYILIRNGFITNNHLHPVYHLVFVTKGHGVLFSNPTKYFLKEKDIFIINPNEKHVYTTNNLSGMSHYTVNFYLMSMSNYHHLDKNEFWESPIDANKIEAYVETMKLNEILDFDAQEIMIGYDQFKWKDILIQIGTFYGLIDQIVKTPFYLLTGSQMQKPLFFNKYYTDFIYDIIHIVANMEVKDSSIIEGSKDYLLNKIIQFLINSISKPFQLSQLAAQFNYSSVYICTYFKKHTGMTITQYINKLKINEACIYLRKTDKTITEISEILNYSSSYHFSNNFKKEKSISPKDYRKYSETI